MSEEWKRTVLLYIDTKRLQPTNLSGKVNENMSCNGKRDSTTESFFSFPGTSISIILTRKSIALYWYQQQGLFQHILNSESMRSWKYHAMSPSANYNPTSFQEIPPQPSAPMWCQIIMLMHQNLIDSSFSHVCRSWPGGINKIWKSTNDFSLRKQLIWRSYSKMNSVWKHCLT